MLIKVGAYVLCVLAVICHGDEESVLDPSDISTDFGLRVYKMMTDGTDDNVFFSPYSMTEALAMTYFGARGNTAEEMADTLGISQLEEVLDEAVEEMMLDLRQKIFKEGQNYTLKLANRLFGQEGHTFLASFQEGLEKYYKAPLEKVDFESDPEKARIHINDWVADKTEDKIKDLLPPGSLSTFTKLVLVNAIYFKGLWKSPFKPQNTKNHTFHLNDNANIDTEMMYRKGMYKHGTIDDFGFSILELPYYGDNDAVSMFILLPNEIEGLKQVETHLTDDLNIVRLNEIMKQEMRQKEIEVFLPKFKITHMFSAKDMLSEMGMLEAFTDDADFSGMDGGDMLKIGDVYHQAFVELNEEGTEAAAATGIVMVTKSAMINPPVFKADKPFLFFIRDNKSQGVLFLGRVTNPSTTSMSRRSSYSWTSSAKVMSAYIPVVIVTIFTAFSYRLLF